MEIVVREADPAEFDVIGEIAVAAYRTVDRTSAAAFLTGMVMNPA